MSWIAQAGYNIRWPFRHTKREETSLVVEVGNMQHGDVVSLDPDASMQLLSPQDRQLQLSPTHEQPITYMGTASQLLAPMSQLFSQVARSGTYKLVIDDPIVRRQFADGVLWLSSSRKGNPNLVTASLMKGNGIAYTAGFELVSTSAIIMPVIIQAASFALAQYHLYQIHTILRNIEVKLNEVLENQDNEIEARLLVCIKQTKDLMNRINLEASVQTSDLQKSSFDKELSDLVTRASEVLMTHELQIKSFKENFAAKIKSKTPISTDEVEKATKIFGRMVRCRRLAILLANLQYSREIVRGNHEEYVKYSWDNLQETITNLTSLEETLRVFTSDLFKRHGFSSLLHDIKSLFFSSVKEDDRKQENNLASWKSKMLGDVKAAQSSATLFVEYNNQAKTLKLIAYQPGKEKEMNIKNL